MFGEGGRVSAQEDSYVNDRRNEFLRCTLHICMRSCGYGPVYFNRVTAACKVRSVLSLSWRNACRRRMIELCAGMARRRSVGNSDSGRMRFRHGPDATPGATASHGTREANRGTFVDLTDHR
jgi:hypothetical protein